MIFLSVELYRFMAKLSHVLFRASPSIPGGSLSQSQHPKSLNQSQESHGSNKNPSSLHEIFSVRLYAPAVNQSRCYKRRLRQHEAANLRKDYNELQIIIRHLHHDWLWYIYILYVYTHIISGITCIDIYSQYSYIHWVHIRPYISLSFSAVPPTWTKLSALAGTLM